MKLTLTLVLDTWGYAKKDGKKEYCQIEGTLPLVMHDWVDLNNIIGYLAEGADGSEIAFKVKAEKEEEVNG